MFAARPEKSLLNQVISIPNALRPTSLWNYFRTGEGMLSTPGADAQIMVPHINRLPRRVPEFCEGSTNPEKVKDLLQTPDLQILLYGGAPDVWELQEKLNIPIDVPLRFGKARDWHMT